MASIIIFILAFTIVITGLRLLFKKQAGLDEKKKFFLHHLIIVAVLILLNLVSFGVLFRNTATLPISENNVPSYSTDSIIIKTTVSKVTNNKYTVTKRTLFGLPVNDFDIIEDGGTFGLDRIPGGPDSPRIGQKSLGLILIIVMCYFSLFVILLIYILGLIGKSLKFIFKKTS
jgi:hypothetical protein